MENNKRKVFYEKQIDEAALHFFNGTQYMPENIKKCIDFVNNNSNIQTFLKKSVEKNKRSICFFFNYKFFIYYVIIYKKGGFV